MPAAITQSSPTDMGNEDARSTSSTLVNGEHGERGDHAVARTQTDRQSTTRHGFENDAYDLIRFLYFSEKRHDTTARPHSRPVIHDWQGRERVKTVFGLLVLCLHLSVDPPDIVKTNPCARLECWIDHTSSLLPRRDDRSIMVMIGEALKKGYEELHSRVGYKVCIDPPLEETKKLCCRVRRSAKNERILFHYNGHGVPKPTTSGEIWVYNNKYTQYIPVSLFDLQTWLGSPVIYVWDCSCAGNIVNAFQRFAEQRDKDVKDVNSAPRWSDSFHLAACCATETLSMDPQLPADVFTSCLTTPVRMSMHWAVMRNPLLAQMMTLQMVHQFPGKLNERRTPLGEMNWIFTAVTDTIAWSVLQDQPKLFRRLFRQDLLVACMFRNFLLADRIMRNYQCTPISVPKLPETHNHPTWQAWDMAVDICLLQLPALLAAENGGPPYQYQPSTYFAEQLTAFEVWLAEGTVHPSVPVQLPVILQVLLSNVHRLRALILLSRFLDLGPWAVNVALSVGIFPYILKLLQSPAAELKPVLIFIWARILAFDRSCQNDLAKDRGFAYFINILTPNDAMLSIPHVSEHRAMSAFILSVFCSGFRLGQQICVQENLIGACLAHVKDPDPLLRQWVCLCLAKLCEGNSESKAAAIASNAHEKMYSLLSDTSPDVRAAALLAISAFLYDSNKTEPMSQVEHSMIVAALVVMGDGSPVVRRELVIVLSQVVHLATPSAFVSAACRTIEEDHVQYVSDDSHRASSSEWRTASSARTDMSFGAAPDVMYTLVWKALLNLSVDPFADVASAAKSVVDVIVSFVLRSPSVDDYTVSIIRDHLDIKREASVEDERRNALPNRRPAPLTRSASFASALKTFYGFGMTDSPQTRNSLDGRRYAGTIGPSGTASSNSSRPIPFPMTTTTSQSTTETSALPLSSGFYDWSCEYFTEPQMRPAEADEPGSIVYTQRKWRRTRNEKILQDASDTKTDAEGHSWGHQITSLYNEAAATHILLHQFESHLIATDRHNCTVVWDWKTGMPLNVIDNGNPPRSHITDLSLINEDDLAILMTASDDGVVRLFRNYDGHDTDEGGAVLVSAWRALKDMERSSSRRSGLVCEWNQARGMLFTGGDARTIKIWDAHQEMQVMEMATQSTACVTSMTSDQQGGQILVAGFGDGMMCVYDRRQRSDEALTIRWEEHTSWVTGVHMQREGYRELVSAGIGGDIRVWDIRESRSLRTIDAHRQGDLSAFSIHDHSRVMASAGDDQVIKVWNVQGQSLSTIRSTSGFLGQKNASTRALAFHPHLMMMAASGNDGYITLYGPRL